MTQRLIAFSRFLLGIAMAFTANFVAGSLAPASDSLRRFDLAYRPLLLVFLLAGFSLLLAGFDRAPGNPLVAMGLGLRGPWLRDLWTGGLFGAGMVAVPVALIAVAGRLAIKVVVTTATLRLAAVVIVILAAGAMAEEITFRGYPFQRMVEAIGPTAAALVLSALFGAVHLANPHASAWGCLDTVLIGLLLSLAYLRTRSLWMPIAIHFWWNVTLGLILGLPVSGLTEFSVVTRARAEGPLWLTGGSYGIEASAVVAAVIALGIVLFTVLVRPREVAAPTQGLGMPEWQSAGEISGPTEQPPATGEGEPNHLARDGNSPPPNVPKDAGVQ